MSTLNNIRIALENHLATSTPTLPDIEWPNVKYDPTEGTPYLQVRFIPVTRRPTTVGPTPEQRYSGLFTVNVCTPQNTGAAAGMALAEQITARFNGSDDIAGTGVTIRLEYSEAKLPLHQPPFYVIPVEIAWYAFT